VQGGGWAARAERPASGHLSRVLHGVRHARRGDAPDFVIGGVRGSKRYCSALLPRGWDFPWFEKLLEVVHLLAPWPDELHYVCRHLEGLSFFVEVAGDGTVEFLQLADG
jgi:hypothetical protein